jgi:hypothetical protein
MCEYRVVSSPKEMRARLLKHASELEEDALVLRRWAEQKWHMPSIEETARARVDWVEMQHNRYDMGRDFDGDASFRDEMERLRDVRSWLYGIE